MNPQAKTLREQAFDKIDAFGGLQKVISKLESAKEDADYTASESYFGYAIRSIKCLCIAIPGDDYWGWDKDFEKSAKSLAMCVRHIIYDTSNNKKIQELGILLFLQYLTQWEPQHSGDQKVIQLNPATQNPKRKTR